MEFCDDLLDRFADPWSRMLDHPFLMETRDGTLEDRVFAEWLRQDYLFVEAAVPFLGTLLSKAPREHRRQHGTAIAALEEELELFRERAEALGVSLEDVEPTLVNHAYVQFLHATAHRRSYPEGYTVLYAAEKAYHESWKVVRPGLAEDSPWYPFVENWAGADFAAYVGSLRQGLDELARDAGRPVRERMARLFGWTVRYEIAFWDMAYGGPDGAGPTA